MPEEHELFQPEKGKGAINAKGPGGIPAWGYGVGLAGVVVVYLYYKNSQSQKAAAASNAAQGSSGAPGQGQYGTETIDVTGGGGGTWYPPWRGWVGGPAPGGFTPTPSTNVQWESLVRDWLISKAENPTDVEDTLGDFLDGQRLDREERAMIDLAINTWGNPPQTPTPSPNPGRKRKPPPPPSPPGHPDPGGPRGGPPPRHDPVPNPGGPNRHTREQTITNPSGDVAGTGKTVVIIE